MIASLDSSKPTMVLPRRDRSPGLRVQLAIIALVVLGLGIWQFQRQPPHVESPTAPTGPATTAPAPPPAADTGSASRAAERESHDLDADEARAATRSRVMSGGPISSCATGSIANATSARRRPTRTARSRSEPWRTLRTPQQPRRSLAEAERKQAESRARLPWTGKGDHRPSTRRGRAVAVPCTDAVVVLRWDGSGGSC